MSADKGGERNPSKYGDDFALHTLVRKSDVDAVRSLLQNTVFLDAVNAQSDQGDTALHLATSLGNIPMIVTLIKGGANVDADNADGRTPLHLAAMAGNMKLAQVLLRAGADVAIMDRGGCIPERLAFATGHMEMATCIRQYHSFRNTRGY